MVATEFNRCAKGIFSIKGGLNELSAVSEPESILLVLDDYHVIDDPAIYEGLTFLLDHLPTNLHVLLATRIDPELPLSRWRVRAEMVEIRAADLRFTATEATTFFTQALGDTLVDDDVRLLEQRTEGWAAGLQLAALALRQHSDRAAFVQRFTGSHRYLLDYLDSSWQAWFDSLQIEHEGAGTTVLIGFLPDQAALYSVLLKLDRLGVMLIGLESSEIESMKGETKMANQQKQQTTQQAEENNANGAQQPPTPNHDLKSLDRLVGTWKMSGDTHGTLTLLSAMVASKFYSKTRPATPSNCSSRPKNNSAEEHVARCQQQSTPNNFSNAYKPRLRPPKQPTTSGTFKPRPGVMAKAIAFSVSAWAKSSRWRKRLAPCPWAKLRSYWKAPSTKRGWEQ